MFKKILLFVSILLTGFVAFSRQLPPKSNTLVTDYTNTLTDSDRQQLENKLVAFDDSTSNQIAIVIIKSVGETDINEYAQKLGNAWGIGQKGKHNGVLILVAIGDRKVSIQTGDSAKKAVPDVVIHEIIQNDIAPRFKQGDYYGGLDVATDDLIKHMADGYISPDKPQPQQQQSSGWGIILLIVIIIIVVIIVFRGRGGGGGGQIYGGRGSASPFWWFLGGALLGRGSGGWGGFSDGNGGFGGNNNGGDSGSGGGGDFGGFSGGDFGGGGSSGSW